MSEEQIAHAIGTTRNGLAHIRRTMELVGDPHAVTAEESILRCYVENGDRASLIENLSDGT